MSNRAAEVEFVQEHARQQEDKPTVDVASILSAIQKHNIPVEEVPMTLPVGFDTEGFE